MIDIMFDKKCVPAVLLHQRFFSLNPQSWDTRLRGKDKYQGTFVPSKGLAIMFT
jgi:hypothetical protein